MTLVLKTGWALTISLELSNPHRPRELNATLMAESKGILTFVVKAKPDL